MDDIYDPFRIIEGYFLPVFIWQMLQAAHRGYKKRLLLEMVWSCPMSTSRYTSQQVKVNLLKRNEDSTWNEVVPGNLQSLGIYADLAKSRAQQKKKIYIDDTNELELRFSLVNVFILGPTFSMSLSCKIFIGQQKMQRTYQ